jgi:hypothetical protein
MDVDRADALRAALDLNIAAGGLSLHCGVDRAETLRADAAAVLDTAETFLAWLRGPVRIHLHPGLVVDQTTGLPSGTHIQGAPVQIHDNEQFTVTAEADDAKGFPTGDPIGGADRDRRRDHGDPRRRRRPGRRGDRRADDRRRHDPAVTVPP